MTDNVNHPPHYTGHPSGIEAIEVTRHFSFCLGNAIKYIWRAGLKNDAIEDLKKARWYLDDEIAKREREQFGITGVVGPVDLPISNVYPFTKPEDNDDNDGAAPC